MKEQQTDKSQFMVDPQLESVECRFSSYTRQVFDRHTHETYSVGLVHQGESHAFLHNKTIHIREGDTIYIPPGVVHACNPGNNKTLVYNMFYIQCSLFEEISDYLFQRSAPGFPAGVIHQPALFSSFTRLFKLMENSHDRLEKQSLLYHAISKLLCLINTHEVSVLPMQKESHNLQQAHEFLMRNLEQNISLRELASQAGLSPYHFLRVFREVYGMTPHAYRLQKRIQAAKKMIAGGTPISQVAFQTGFTDQSHFTRRFKAYVGVTPNEFHHNLLVF